MLLFRMKYVRNSPLILNSYYASGKPRDLRVQSREPLYLQVQPLIRLKFLEFNTESKYFWIQGSIMRIWGASVRPKQSSVRPNHFRNSEIGHFSCFCPYNSLAQLRFHYLWCLNTSIHTSISSSHLGFSPIHIQTSTITTILWNMHNIKEIESHQSISTMHSSN